MQERTSLDDQLAALGRIEQELSDNIELIGLGKIRKWNRLHGNQVRAGQTLRIYRPVAEPATARQMASNKTPKYKKASSLQASNGERLLHHKVKSGETLVSIANRYNTSVAALRRDNKISSLKAGDVLVIRTP